MKVMVINHCSTNKGDRAVLYFVLRELVRGGVEEVYVSASRPEFWAKKPALENLNVTFVPWGAGRLRRVDANFCAKVLFRCKTRFHRRGVFKTVRQIFLQEPKTDSFKQLGDKSFHRVMQDADVVISTGGHHVTTINAPEAETPQIFEMMTALLYNKPVCLWSQSIGPFDFRNQINSRMIREILFRTKRIYVRDDASLVEVAKLGLSGENVSRTYESVFGLRDAVESDVAPSEREPILGISVWTGRKPTVESRESYVQSFSELVNRALGAGYRIRFFPMEMGGEDLPYLEQLRARAQDRQRCEIITHWPDTPAHLKLISECRMFAGHKTHSQVFALTTATPLLALAYHVKTHDFMKQFGLSEYCLDDSRLSGEGLTRLFDAIDNNLNAIFAQEKNVITKISSRVREDFSAMLHAVRSE